MELISSFNGSLEDAKKYYLNQVFNMGSDTADVMTTVVEVEQIKGDK